MICTKYCRLDEAQAFPGNVLRHYYDVYCLLGLEEMQAFIREPAYQVRKAQRFRRDDEQVIGRNPAFVLTDAAQRERFVLECRKTQALYYQGQPDFDALGLRAAWRRDEGGRMHCHGLVSGRANGPKRGGQVDAPAFRCRWASGVQVRVRVASTRRTLPERPRSRALSGRQ